MSFKLPVQSCELNQKNMKENYEKMGIKVIGKSSGDDLFYDVILPKGWTIKRTNSILWSNLVDENGNKRVSIFYRPSLYDRDADACMITRYQITTEFVEKKDSVHTFAFKVIDTKSGNIIYDPGNDENAGITWLDENYPEWKDPFAYWDSQKNPGDAK